MSFEWWSFTRDRRPVVDLLCLLYGLSSWLAITGLWMELPLLVHALPEGWVLSASLSLAIQLGNVGPLLYGLGRFFCARYCTGPRALSAANHLQLCVGLAACVVLICSWKVTAVVLGHETSLVLLVAAFALSIVDCTSSVVYLPFMGRFREVYMTSYLVGEGVGGIVPSLVALAQGLSEPECINRTGTLGVGDTLNSSLAINRTSMALQVGATNFEPEVFFGVLLVLVVLSYAAFVLLDNCRSFQTEWSYSCLPYGPRTLHLAVTLCGIAYPAACALAMFVVLRRMPHLCAQTLLGTLGAAYITLTAATSPTPPLVDTDAGAFLVVLFWVATFLVLSYAKTMVTLVLASHGEKALFWVGACTQLGALIGSLVPYLLVSHLRLFTERDHCADA
ncbi:riboflavin transporter 2-like isoform X2 [Amblyomma americanum]